MAEAFERCVISKGVKTFYVCDCALREFERCVISKGVKTLLEVTLIQVSFERCVISKGVKTHRIGLNRHFGCLV